MRKSVVLGIMNAGPAHEVYPQPKLVVIGGGTGAPNIMQSAKYEFNVTGVMNMSDDGGSSKILMDQYGGLPPGDTVKGQAALCTVPERAADYVSRPDGVHSKGNLRLKELELRYGIDRAIQMTNEELRVRGDIVPITNMVHVLELVQQHAVTRGEHVIGHMPIPDPNAYVRLSPEAPLHPRAQSAIQAADMIVIAPGNRFGSIYPALAVQGLKAAVSASDAQKVLVCNLLTKPMQTDRWDVVDDALKVEKYIGEGMLDAVLYNTGDIPDVWLEHEAEPGQKPVRHNTERFNETRANFIGGLLVSRTLRQVSDATSVPRTKIMHDSQEITNILQDLYAGHRKSV